MLISEKQEAVYHMITAYFSIYHTITNHLGYGVSDFITDLKGFINTGQSGMDIYGDWGH